ncbi:hypothetical protein WJ438_19725 [Streptomyces sp. GD-15H]|uniref:hypothetical protein n=1 Tax=Streptomyces sp. GD-15H TaxID=3129112 RepID=UPI00325079CD
MARARRSSWPLPGGSTLRRGRKGAVSGAPATVIDAWNIQWVEPGLFSCPLTRKRDTSHEPSCRRARPRTTTFGKSRMWTGWAASPPSTSFMVTCPEHGTRW